MPCNLFPSFFLPKVVTGLNVLESSLKLTKLLKSIFSIQASKSHKRDFRDFSEVNVCYSNTNVNFENFMHSEWSEVKFLEGSVGHQTRVCF
mmetsp:Transcript_80833/g.131010  ORF Transcript_80833/g.131010 Transcript_80833/m.131010 type:complete len:91 (+) Transcript_80833:849-1121(+)